MLYHNIRPDIVYGGQKEIPLPRGATPGYGNALFILTPSQDDTLAELRTDYIRWFLDHYWYYTTDTYFREKIGKKYIMVNMTQTLRRDWANTPMSHPLRLVLPRNRSTMLKKNQNLLVDMGEWSKYYFQYSFKVSIPVIVKNYISFLNSKLNVDDYKGYGKKILYIPLDAWHKQLKGGLGFTKPLLNNPLAIILFASYKYPDIFGTLPEMDIIIGSAQHQQFIQLNTKRMDAKVYPIVKSRLLKMTGVKWDEKSENTLSLTFTPEEEDPNSELNNQPDTEKYSDPKNLTPAPEPDASDEEKAKAQLKQDNRARLLNEMKRNLIGDATTPSDTNKNKVNLKPAASPDPTITDEKVGHMEQKVGKKIRPISDLTQDESVYDEEDVEAQKEDTTPIHLDDDEMDGNIEEAVDDEIEKLQEEDPDVLLNQNGQLNVDTIKANVSSTLKKSWMPEHSEAAIKRMKELRTAQDKVLKKYPTAKEIKSKTIDTTDFSKAIKTQNPHITQSKFVNFDRDYNTKKLPYDIDAAVAKLNEAQVPIFVTSKTEEDTSTQLDLKKTVTYELEDEWGEKHKVVLDIPIIVDDKYIYKNGQKQLLGHQMFMMPIVKANPTDVQIVTWYNKLILRREGVNDTRTAAVKRFMTRNAEKFSISLGNATAKNHVNHYKSTLDIDMYGRQFMGFSIGNTRFYLDREELLQKLHIRMPNAKLSVDESLIPVGFNAAKGDIIYVSPDRSLTDIILEMLPADTRVKIVSSIKKREMKLLRTSVKIMNQMVPLVLILCFFEPFETVMKKAELDYFTVDINDDISDIDRAQYDFIYCSDKIIVWPRNPIWNTMLMNGFANLDLSDFTYEEVTGRDMYINLLSNYWSSVNIANSLMQFYDFMIDPATKEILEDMELPTDLVSLMLLGNRMLADNEFTPINNAESFRIRSNEIIAQAVYTNICAAYSQFRKTQNKMGRNRKPDKLNVRQDAVMTEITFGSSLTNEASVLNPILELEKARSVTPRGPRGVGKERAMTEQKRAYDPSMVGILGMTTSPDYKVGVNRQLTLEPNITSTRGYVKVTDMKDVDNLNAANLLTPSELLSPPGVLHDDGPRTAMGYKQSQYMLPVAGSTPVFFGNKVESVIPYHMSREFVITAKQDGQVVEIKDGWIIVQYKDGSYDSIDTNPRMRKNSSSGFFIKTHMQSHLKEVGQKFKQYEVLAQDARAFSKDDDDLGASMNIGVPIKVAIIPNYDIYEDAAPITEKLSEKFTTYMSMQVSAGIPAQSYVESIVQVGQRVEVGDPLIVYDPAHEDEEINAFLNEIRSKLGDTLADVVDIQSLPQVRTEYAGTVAAIEIYTSVPVEELSPSLQKVYKDLTARGARSQELLTKYQNEGDMNYYKCGRILDQSPEVIKPDYQNRVKGVIVSDDGRGVAIFFYIEFKDIAKTGDKGSAFTALKFTTSHVIPKGKEPYSEYRPDEEISTLIAPSSIIARKTPSIIQTMFANKCIIEMKRHALAMFFEDKDPDEV